MPQTYPWKAVTIVVPFGPGKAACDIEARHAAPFLARAWGKSVAVENRPAREGLDALEAVAAAQPDGHTLLWCTASLPAYAVLKKDSRADSLANLVPIAQVVDQPVGLMTGGDTPARDIDEFVAYAKAHPGKIRYRTIPRSPTSLIMKAFSLAAGIRMHEVVYPDADERYFNALESGDVQLVQTSLREDVRMKVDAGGGRVLLTIGSSRAGFFPEVPTSTEKGWQIPKNSWQALLAPAGTPDSVLEQIHAAASGYAANPDARQQALTRGIEIMCTTRRELGQLLARDAETWAEVAAAFGLEPQ